MRRYVEMAYCSTNDLFTSTVHTTVTTVTAHYCYHGYNKHTAATMVTVHTAIAKLIIFTAAVIYAALYTKTISN